MINNPYPTRAEANDIYNILELDAKGLVLAAETAIDELRSGSNSTSFQVADALERAQLFALTHEKVGSGIEAAAAVWERSPGAGRPGARPEEDDSFVRPDVQREFVSES